MQRLIIKLVLVLVSLAVTTVAVAQTAAPAKDPAHSLISIYRIAPGKHADFLKWMAAREAVGKEIGGAATQWYAHVDGDSWDYVAVGPDNSADQAKKLEAALKKHGLTTGFKQSIEVRQFISSHTDTFAVGPVTVSELADWAAAK